jgi:hypothetical protein
MAADGVASPNGVPAKCLSTLESLLGLCYLLKRRLKYMLQRTVESTDLGVITNANHYR